MVNGKSRIYSIRENRSRVATLEVTGQLTQYKGRERGPDLLAAIPRDGGEKDGTL